MSKRFVVPVSFGAWLLGGIILVPVVLSIYTAIWPLVLAMVLVTVAAAIKPLIKKAREEHQFRQMFKKQKHRYMKDED